MSPCQPLVSIIVLNYNGAAWLERCLRSLREQTTFGSLEIVVADNASPDGSDRLAAKLMEGWTNGRVIQHGANLGYCEGNNRAARQTSGKWLFFLNNDAWLEPNCLEILVRQTEEAHADASGPLVMDYESCDFQSLGAAGFDLFTLATARQQHRDMRPVFMPEGCAYLISRRFFDLAGGFDREFFMYVDEFDLSWRVWLAGGKIVAVPAARLHHRGAAQVNPAGAERVLELRTSDTKRFYTNRNHLVCVLKNGQNLLLTTLPLQLALYLAEALAALILVRRWSFIRRAYLGAVSDCWRLRHHIRAERRRHKAIRKRSDLWMLRFLKARLNRWEEIQRIRRLGLPRVSAK